MSLCSSMVCLRCDSTFCPSSVSEPELLSKYYVEQHFCTDRCLYIPMQDRSDWPALVARVVPLLQAAIDASPGRAPVSPSFPNCTASLLEPGAQRLLMCCPPQ